MTNKYIFVFSLSVVVFFMFVFGHVFAQTAPVISNLRVENIIGSGAQVKWTTNVASDSRVLYGASSTDLNLFSSSRCDATGDVLEHCVNLTGLSYGTVYYYKAESSTSGCTTMECSVHSAINSFTSGSSSDNTTGTGTTSMYTIPAAPGSLFSAVSGTSVNLSWTDNAVNETEYKVFRRLLGGTWAFLAPLGANVTSYSDSVIVAGTYEYHINACNSNGCSSDSNIASSTIVTTSITSSPSPTPTYSPTPTPTSSPSPTPTYSPPIPTYSPTPAPTADAVVLGTVFDSQGRAVAEAWYHIFKSDYSLNFDGTADSTGSFKVSLPAGSYVAEVFPSPEHYNSGLLRPEPQEFSILSGETKSLTFKFKTGSKTITGTILFSSGQPVTDAEVGAYSHESGQWTGGSVNSSGGYNISVSGGTWEVGIRPKDPSTAQWSYTGLFQTVEFAKDTLAETKTVNFTVSVSDVKLIVKTVDESGRVIPFAGVVVDVISSNLYLPGSVTQAVYMQTDTNGLATFYLKPGAYFIRSYLPDNNGYVNPQEQSISINSGETKNLQLIFRRKDTVTTVAIKGVTKLDDGLPIDAFVWAWSEKGDFNSTRSGANGEFSFQVVPNDKWHLGAGKESGGLPYKSSDLVIAVGNTAVSVEIILSKTSELPLPVPVQVTSQVSQQIITQTADGAKVVIPPNSAPVVGSINVEIKPTVEAPSQAAAKVIGTVYDVVVKDSAGQQVTKFTQDIEITLPYDESALSAQGISESNISPSYYDDTTGTWVKVDNYTVDKEKNIIIVRTGHLTRYAIVAAADITPPADVTGVSGVALGGGKIKLIWINPIKDFSHAKIYRSETADSLSKIVASEVTGNEYTDGSGLLNGTTYYYTVRSVDPAGNESSTTKQTTIKAIGTSVVQTATLIYGLNDGDVVSAAGSDDPDVYIVNLQGFKRLFLNPVIFNFYGHLGGFSKVKNITPATRDKFGTSGIFRNCETNDPKVYGVEVTGEDTAILRWVNTSGEQAVADDADFFKKVFCINTREFNWYKTGSVYSSVTQIPAYSR